MKVCVTGASGFIGSVLVGRLVQDGHTVMAFSRRAFPLGRAGVFWHAGDIRDPATLEQALKGTDAVVHLAAVTSVGSHDQREAYSVNVEGTRVLVDVCRRMGISRVVYVGTLSSLRPEMSSYGASKLEAERILSGSDLQVTIVRPHLVYGPGEQGLFARLVRLVRKSPIVPVLGSGKNPVQPVHVDDVADCISESLRRAGAIGQQYNLVGPDLVTMNRFTDMVCEALYLKRWRVNVPGPIGLLLARTFSLLMKNPPFTVDNLVGMSQDLVWSSDDAVRDLDYRPRPLAIGLQQAVIA